MTDRPAPCSREEFLRRRTPEPMKGAQHVRRAWKCYSKGDIPVAEAEFTKAVEVNPKAALGHLQQGLFLLRQDRFEEAVSSFRRAAVAEPKNPAPTFFLAVATEQAGKDDDADLALESLKQLCPRHQGLTSLRLLRDLRRGDPLPTLTALGFGLPPGQKNAKENWRSLAAGIGVGNPDWLPPDLSSSNYLMGPILIEIEKKLLAREVPALEHRTSDLLSEVENAKPAKRKLSEELQALRNFCKSGAKLRQGKKLLAQAFEAEPSENPQTLAKKAVAKLRLARRLDPFAFRTDYYIGEAYLIVAKQQAGSPYCRFPLLQAESAFIRSTKLDGSNPYVLFFLAFVSHALGRPLTAIATYAKATERFTKLPEAHYGSGQCHLLLGQTAKARELMLTAVNSDLALGRERLNLFANLLREEGPEAFSRALPEMPPEPEPPVIDSSIVDDVDENSDLVPNDLPAETTTFSTEDTSENSPSAE